MEHFRGQELEKLRKENLDLKKELEDQKNYQAVDLKTLSVIHGLITVPMQASGLQEVSRRIIDRLILGLDEITGCEIYLFKEPEQLLRLLAAQGEKGGTDLNEAVKGGATELQPGEGVAGRVFLGNEPYWGNRDQPGLFRSQRLADLGGAESLASLPLSHLGRHLGVLNLTFRKQRPFDKLRQRSLLILAGVVAGNIHRLLANAGIGDHAINLERQIEALEQEIAGRKQLQRQLQQALKMEAVGNLAGGVAHDFNNTLQVIAGYSELIAQSASLDRQAARHLQKINQATKKAADLVKNLLTFSRQSEPSLRHLDLNQLVSQTKSLLTRLIPKRVQVDLELNREEAWIRADPIQVEQIILNLATNARDAMPQGGRLLLKTYQQELDPEFCDQHQGSQPGRYVCLEVSDNGQGMDPQTQSRIFDPFFTTKGVGQGTGLGLAVVHDTVKNHQGYITCQSEPGRGACFHIYLPVAEKPSHKSAAKLDEELRGGSELILLVDDEVTLAEACRENLEAWGYRVMTALSGEEALAVMKENPAQLVILDLDMPGMGGEACLRELLAMDPLIKVIISTGFAQRGQAARYRAIGASGFLAKPYGVSRLLRLVRQILDHSPEAGGEQDEQPEDDTIISS